jgi:predicted O-methyltransferase YrrM
MSQFLQPLRKFKHRLWAYIFDQLFSTFVKDPEKFAANPVMMRRLVYYWGNASMAAGLEYASYCAAEGLNGHKQVLECGAGLSSLLIAATGKKNNTEITSFDDHPFWAGKMQQMAIKFGLDNLRVLHTPIKDYGKFEWYDYSNKPLPEKFDLVLCDGPPGETKGGRFGLFPCMESQFHNQTKIVLDDYGRQGEKDVALKWEIRYGWKVTQTFGKKPFAILEKPA